MQTADALVRTTVLLLDFPLPCRLPQGIVHGRMSTTLPGLVRRSRRATRCCNSLSRGPLMSSRGHVRRRCRRRRRSGGVVVCSISPRLRAELLSPALQAVPSSALVRRDGNSRGVERIGDEVPVVWISFDRLLEQSIICGSPRRSIRLLRNTFSHIPRRWRHECGMARRRRGLGCGTLKEN